MMVMYGGLELRMNEVCYTSVRVECGSLFEVPCFEPVNTFVVAAVSSQKQDQ